MRFARPRVSRAASTTAAPRDELRPNGLCPVRRKREHEQRRRLARRLAADGVLSPTNVALNVCPMARVYRTLEIMNEFCEHAGATVLPMAAIASDEEIYEQATLFAANTLIGMPSRLLAFARTMQENRFDLAARYSRLRRRISPAGQRRFLRDVLGVKRFSGIYGSAELGIVAWHPDLPLVPLYHFPRDILHVEIVNPDATASAPWWRPTWFASAFRSCATIPATWAGSSPRGTMWSVWSCAAGKVTRS